MAGIDFGRFRAQLSLRDVLALLRFTPVSGNAGQLRGPCPFVCSPSGRSFVAYLTSNRYYCFSCHRSGNPLDLWAAARHLPIYDAALDLCRQLRIDPPLL